MLRLKKLRLGAIGRFVDPQEVDFDKLDDLVEVAGHNLNTGGSSGSAKSTIFNAIDYLLGLNDLPNAVLQSRLTKEPMFVEGYFDLDGKELIIIRGKNKFSIELDGEVTSGSAKLTEEKLDRILAMPRNLFRPMLHKRQKEGGFFLNMTPSKIHEFLMDCSNLSKERERLEKVDLKIRAIEDYRAACDSKIRQLQAAIGATKDAILALGPPPAKKADRAAIEALKSRADASAKRFYQIVEDNKVAEETLEAQRPTIQARKYDTSKAENLKAESRMLQDVLAKLENEEEIRAQDADKELKILQDKAYVLTRIIDVADNMKQDATGIAMQIRSTLECVCPTCHQSWVGEKSKVHADELAEKLEVYKVKIAEGTKAKEELKELRFRIQDLKPMTKAMVTDRIKSVINEINNLHEQIVAENKREQDFNNATFYLYNATMKDFSDRQKALRERNTIAAEQASGQMNMDRVALESVINSLKSYEEAKDRYDETLSNLTKQEDATKSLLIDAETSLMDANDDLKLAEEAKKAIKSYISCSFDDSLVQIGETATRIVRGIPNMANTTLQLEGIRETKEGKLKEEVNAVISSDGEIGIPIKSLSGGERSAVDLAIDLAVIDLIEQKTGKGIDVFILDEPFTGLDTVSIEMTLEMLKNSNINKRLIIVDHNPEVKQMVESKITVIRDGATSRIEQ